MKVTHLTRKVVVTAATWAAGDWTLTTGANHMMSVGETFSFTDPTTTAVINATAIAGTATTVLKFTDVATLTIPQAIEVANYGTGSTGAQGTFTFQFNGASMNGLIHVVSNGTATATVKCEGSLDNLHWVDLAAAQGITAGAQIEIAVAKPYVYGRLNFTVASATAGGVANTIKAYKSGC